MKNKHILIRIDRKHSIILFKHAEASSVSFQLIEIGNYIELIIEDNGKRF